MRHSDRRLSTQKLLLVAGASVCVLGAVIIFFLTRPTDTKQPEDTTASRVVTYSTDTPDEVKPTDDYDWKGRANDPKKIVIPSLNVENFIQNVGVDQKSEIAVPENIHLAGWFVDSVRPGDKGLSIIDGHLNGPQTDGIFIGLEKMNSGDTFSIEFGDNTSRTFVVRKVQTVDLAAAADVLYSQDPSIMNQLNLITCGGDYDRDARLYSKRVIVTAERVENESP